MTKIGRAMRIRYKILLGYAALITVLITLIAFFLLTLSDVNHRYSNLINRDQRILLQANNFRASAQRQIVAASTYQQIGDDSLLREYNEAVRQQQQSLQEILHLLYNEADLLTISGIRQGSETYSTQASEAMDLSRNPEADTTGQTLKRVQSETARLALLNLIDVFVANKNSQVEAARAQHVA